MTTLPSFQPGRYVLTPTHAQIEIKVWKEGLLSRLGHDLTLQVNRFEVVVQVPESDEAIEIEGLAWKDAFEILSPPSLSNRDRREIKKNIRKHLPGDIRFSGRVSLGDVVQIKGEFSVGVKPAFVSLTPSMTETEAKVSCTLSHRALGIEPYKAPLGVIKLKDHLDLSMRFDLSMLSSSPT